MKKGNSTPLRRFIRYNGILFRQLFANREYFYFWIIATLCGVAYLESPSPYVWGLVGLANWNISVAAVGSVVRPIDKALESISLDYQTGYGLPTWIVEGKYPAAQDKICFNAAGYAAQDFEKFSAQISSRLSQPIKEIRKPFANSPRIEIVFRRSNIPSTLEFKNLPIGDLKPGEFFMGQSDDGLERLTLAQMIHMLVGGQTGSGKTQFLRQLLASLLSQTRDIHVCLTDMKGGIDFQQFRDLPNFELATSYEEADQLLDRLLKLFEIRRDFLIEKRKANWSELIARDLKGEKALRGYPTGYVVAMVDELGELSKKATEKAAKSDLQEKIATLARLARVTGIHLILGTQRPSKDVVSMQSKDNLPSRICFSVPSVAASTLVVGDMSASNLGNLPGRAVFQLQGTKIIQSPLITNGEIEKLMDSLRERLKRSGYNRSVKNPVFVEHDRRVDEVEV